MSEQSNGQAEPGAEALARRSIRKRLRDGIEVALCADPDLLAHYKPRTVLGLIVRRLVLEAGKGRMTAVKLMMQLLDWDDEEERRNSLSQGISEGILKKSDRDRSTNGAWLAPPQAEAEGAATNLSPNSLVQGISQGILKKVAPERDAMEEATPLNRQQRRRLAAMSRQRAKEEAGYRQLAKAA